MPKLTNFQSFFHMLYNINFLQKNSKKKHTHKLRRRSLKQGKLLTAKKKTNKQTKKIYIYITVSRLCHLNYQIWTDARHVYLEHVVVNISGQRVLDCLPHGRRWCRDDSSPHKTEKSTHSSGDGVRKMASLELKRENQITTYFLSVIYSFTHP